MALKTYKNFKSKGKKDSSILKPKKMLGAALSFAILGIGLSALKRT